MKKYRCVRDCCIKFANRRVWREGMTAEVEDNIDVPSHFELVGVEKYHDPKKDEMSTFSGIQNKQKELSKKIGGFASSLNALEPEITIKRKR
jgi:hypothetical protein